MLSAREEELLDLRDEVYELRERNKTLTDALMSNLSGYPQVVCSTAGHRALDCLMAADNGFRTRHEILAVVGRHNPDSRIVDVIMCKLRKQLPAGATIRTVHGVGHQIIPESVAFFAAGKNRFILDGAYIRGIHDQTDPSAAA